MPQANTELAAVNTILWSIGEAPVNSIDTGLRLVASARALLTEVSSNVQEAGWYFNTVFRKLLPDPSGRIFVSPGVASFEPAGSSSGRSIALQGTTLFDLDNDTLTFDGSVEGVVIEVLDWGRLPRPAQSYITIRAARRFQDQEVGSETINQFQVADEMTALHALRRLDTRNAGMIAGRIGRYGGPVVPPGFPSRRRRYG